MWIMDRALFISAIVLNCLLKRAICQTPCHWSSERSDCGYCTKDCIDSICKLWSSGDGWIPCPCYGRPKFYCNGEAFTPCLIGHVCASHGMTSPSPCPVGSYCPYSYMDYHIPCLIGSICPVQGLSAPSPCPGGRICSTTGLSAAPLLCPVGSICPIGSSAPTPCPPNSAHICNTPGRATLCNNGTYTTGGIISTDDCLICPAGSKCVPDGTPPVPCPAGTFSSRGATECTLCGSGTYTSSPGSTQCSPCPAGNKCVSDGSLPVLCPAGTFSPYGATQCTPCANGTYSSSAGSPVCTMCPLGFTTSPMGATSLAQCACRPGYSRI